MNGLINFFLNQTEACKPDSREEIIEQLRQTREKINCTLNFFENECDGDMIDSCIYELEALGARHRYLTKRLLNCKQNQDGINEEKIV